MLDVFRSVHVDSRKEVAMRALPADHAVALRPSRPGNAPSFPACRQGERGIMPAAKTQRSA
ncbi:hypothetical protein Rhow_002192 [Rhodococcus wratislaviensis]|uniref:Uncharacterized protein n=1 Tax=Rhodococcus wratislaviensis TaxID=44752 RepID=A0A402C521_RHOWR|nr:hypothetical protein Rhow_002192 [Rhodococcus wratislaviensis]